jgi:CubicO group peptidase (beta-lactamase class C family)
MPDTSPLPQATPESVGLSIRQLRQAMDVLHAEVEDGHIGGAVFGIARHGKLAWLEAVGYRDRDAGDAMRTDAIFPLASMTKPIDSVAAMMLVERGKLLLADPVSRYLPQFADMQIAVETRDSRTGTARTVLQPASSEITVQDLLRHTAGMVNANLLPRTSVRQRYLDAGVTSTDQSLAERVDKLAQMPLAHHPGTAWEYSMAADVTGRLIEIASGMPLDRFVAANITGPLQMVDTDYHVPEQHWRRIAQPVIDPETGQLPNHQDPRHPPKLRGGNSGMVATAGDYLRFAQMMLDGGALGDVRILGAGTVAHMRSDHLGSISRDGEIARALLGPARGFGLGFAVRLAAGEHPMPGSIGDYDWSGAYRTRFLIDPKQDLVAVSMINQANYLRHSQLFRTLVYQTLAE